MKIEIDNEKDLRILTKGPLNSPYIFLIPFRNQEKRIQRCLTAMINQKNTFDIPFELLLVDDASTDRSVEIIQSYLKGQKVPYTLISNVERKWKTRNLYNAVNLMKSEESVIIEFDGDDFLPGDKDVLGMLNSRYEQGCLKTFGSFDVYSDDGRFSLYFNNLIKFGIPHDTHNVWDMDKCVNWAPLRSYKVKLFRSVPLDYFVERDTKQWLKMGEDEMIHPMMSEIAGPDRVAFIDEKLYIYDISGEEHDINYINNKNYLTFKLFKIPSGLQKDDLTKKFKTYEDACQYNEQNKASLVPAISKITPVFSDFQNDSGLTLWGTTWITFADTNTQGDFEISRNLSQKPPIETVLVGGRTVKAGRLHGYVGSDRNTDGKKAFFIMMLALFSGYDSKTSQNIDLSSNDFVRTLPPTGATGLKVSLMVGKKYGQTYLIRIDKSGIPHFNQFLVAINDRDIPDNEFKEFVLPFPVFKENAHIKLHSPSHLETELNWAQSTWGELNVWGRSDFNAIGIYPILQAKAADIYINKIEFY